MADKATIKIDDKEYAIDELSNEAKALVQSILYVNNKITDLRSQIAVLNAAREYYLNNLRQLLNKKEEDSDKIKFS